MGIKNSIAIVSLFVILLMGCEGKEEVQIISTSGQTLVSTSQEGYEEKVVSQRELEEESQQEGKAISQEASGQELQSAGDESVERSALETAPEAGVTSKEQLEQEPQQVRSDASEKLDTKPRDKERNPFLTSEEEEMFKMGEIIDYLNLSAIFYSPHYSYAVIDGRIIKEKDIIDNKEVILIKPEKVILEDSQRNRYVIKIKGVIGKKYDKK